MKYPKPVTFSDPYFDWEGYDEKFQEVLKKKECDLEVGDYWMIYYKNLPAANYQEGCYFLDHCFQYIAHSKVIHKSVYPDGLLWWLDHFKEDLERDQLWDWCVSQLQGVLRRQMSEFELFDLDEKACEEIGRHYDYSVGPHNQGTIHDIFDELVIYDSFEPLLEEFISYLESSEELSVIRWYVDIAFHTRVWALLYRDDSIAQEVDNFERKEALFHRMHSFKIYSQKSRIASSATADEEKYKYNRLVSL